MSCGARVAEPHNVNPLLLETNLPVVELLKAGPAEKEVGRIHVRDVAFRPLHHL